MDVVVKSYSDAFPQNEINIYLTFYVRLILNREHTQYTKFLTCSKASSERTLHEPIEMGNACICFNYYNGEVNFTAGFLIN